MFNLQNDPPITHPDELRGYPGFAPSTGAGAGFHVNGNAGSTTRNQDRWLIEQGYTNEV